MVDVLTVGSPISGRLAERVVLISYLRRVIRQRNRHLLASVGATASTDVHLTPWPQVDTGPFRRSEASRRIGRGEMMWQRASRDVLRWEVKTRSGRVCRRRSAAGIARVAGLTIREPVQVAGVVETATRVRFSCRTLPGHPVSGEEAFIVHRDGEDVVLTVCSLTAPAARQPWWALYPLLRAQLIARRRYLRSLR